jgi:hypothetical protein
MNKAVDPLAYRVIAPTRYGDRPLSLTTTMHSLALDTRHPIALEIARANGRTSFHVRATDSVGLRHLASQIHTRYSQAELVPLAPQDDPLRLEQGEMVSLVELETGAPAYLPLRTYAPAQPEIAPEADPLLSILGALDAVPSDLRAVCQLSLVPAPANWSRRYQRKAIEHALDPERLREQRQLQHLQAASIPGNVTGARSPQLFQVCLLGVALLVCWSLLPPWAQDALIQMFHGQRPQLDPPQGLLFVTVALLLIPVVLLGGLVSHWVAKRLRPPLYDMELVNAHVSQAAYRVRFRLLVIGPVAHIQGRPLQSHAPGLLANVGTALQHRWERWRTHCQIRRQREAILSSLSAAYRAYDLSGGNYLQARKRSTRQGQRIVLREQQSSISRTVSPTWATAWWQGIARAPMVLSVDALASLWHLPAAALLPELAGMEQRPMRSFLIPSTLAEATQTLPPMGDSEHAGHRVPFSIPPTSLTQHMIIAGKSGEGKSTCQEHLAQASMQQGGLVVIDPHGDLVEHLLHLVPAHRAHDVVLIDLADPDFAVGFNPLDASIGRGRDKAVSDLITTFSDIWPNTWGPRMENAFEYACRTIYGANQWLVMQDPINGPDQQYTLLDIMAVLTDESFCHSLLDHIDDPFITRWWHLYYDPLSDIMQRERSDPVLSKIAKFESQIARRIVGQPRSTINFIQAIQQEKILFLKLAKGEVGEDVARLLGATFLGLLQIALAEQGQVEEHQRKHMGILIDEFQVLSGVDWGAIAELRKYGATFYLATQSLEYLREMQNKLLSVMLANVKQYILFHMSAQDAETIADDVGVETKDLINLAPHSCYLSLRHQKKRLPTFSATFSVLPRSDRTHAETIRAASRQRYATPVETVERHLKEALIRSLAAQSEHEKERGRRANEPRRGNALHDQPGLARQENGYRGRKPQRPRQPQTGTTRHSSPVSPPNLEEEPETGKAIHDTGPQDQPTGEQQ